LDGRGGCGGEHIYHYHICGKQSDPFPDAVRGRCPHDRLRAAGVNEAVWTSRRNLLLDSDAFAQELTAWVERQTTTPSDQDVRTRKAKARLEELTRQRDRLTDAYQTGALALEPFCTRIQALEVTHAAAELALAEIKTKHLELELARSRALGAQEVVSALNAKLLDADFDTQQTILHLLVERVVVHSLSRPLGGMRLSRAPLPRGHQHMPWWVCLLLLRFVGRPPATPAEPPA
jgi:hypothetical protein